MNDMTHDEALDAVHQINHKTRELVALLVSLRERNGWAALGFKNWTACLSSDLFTYSRKQLYEFVRAAPVTERLQNAGYTVNHSIANVLASFPEEIHIPTIQTAQKRHGKLTESNVKRTAEVFQQATKTGHVESEPGTTNALEAALDTADLEAAKRHIAYQYPLTQPTPPATIVRTTDAKQTVIPVLGGHALVFHVANEKVTLRIDNAALLDALREAQRCDYPVYVMIQRTSKRPQFAETVDAMARFGRTSTRLPIGREDREDVSA